jgi:cytochrome c oxidase subunit III
VTFETPRATLQADRPPIPNHRLGMMVFLVAESMLFTGLLGGYLVLRYSTPMWPPEGQPLLPLWAGTANLVFLAAGSVGIQFAVAAVRRASHRGLLRGISACLGSGFAFVAVLGVEWIRLRHEGLSLTQGGTYGALFYVLTGCHALHVLAVQIWVGTLLALALKDRFSPAHHEPVEMAAMFWHFVGVAWLVLFVILYLL